jgi:mRNA interferase YafQ
MYKVYTTNRFEKDLRLCKKRNYDLNLLKEVIDLLQKDGNINPIS